MIIGAAVLPTAPLLIPGISRTLPDGVADVADAVDAVLEGLPAPDVAVLVASAARTGVATAVPDERRQGQQHGLYDVDSVDLAAVGRPDIRLDAVVHRGALERLSRVTRYPLSRGEPVPLGLVVLALQYGESTPIVPVAVPASAGFDALVAVGAGIAEALTQADLRAVMLVAGDLSAGLSDTAPLAAVPGAQEFDDQIVDVVESGRLEGLARLGPEEARRVGAVGWAPLVVLHGALARAKVGMVVRHYSAPRGVGYLVASGG